MNLTEKIKELRSCIISNDTLSKIVHEPSLKEQCKLIDDLCGLALKYMICGYEHKAARCYIYALALLSHHHLNNFSAV